MPPPPSSASAPGWSDTTSPSSSAPAGARRVTAFLESVTPELLDEVRNDPWGGGWHPTVGDCLRVILEEEWAHLRYTRRDLALLR